MWFTKVSLHNPVFATMVMVALMVLGLFSYQRLKVDQFPNVDFPVVVVTVDYPGASPEIVESEVTRKVEEAVNSIAGINALTSRSYAGTSLVVIEFQLHIEGRQAAEDVREKVASVRPLLRDEVEEPRVLRFDPADAAVWSLAVLPTMDARDARDAGDAGGATASGKTLSAIELTSWADQVLKKRLENVRGVGAVNLIGATPREINLYLDPQALEAFGISVDQVAQAVRSENQDLPVGAVRSLAQERMVQIDARLQRPEDFADIIVARRQGAAVRLGQLARVLDGAQEVESLALYNGQRSLLLSVQKAQGDNTIEVVDGLRRAVAAMQAQLPPGVRLEPIGDMARPIRVAVDNVRQTLIEGAALTVLIVFLFLNSWRSTVITGLTLPIALIGTFLFMHWLGFSINMVTLMALSLCVGLLIDDAIVVRENIVRHLQMGKTPYAAAMDGTQEIGLAVLATTLSIVAVFLPIGFMQGIIGKFFHEFGLTIVVAVLISMFVSFTLDPMLSSVWHDPSVHGEKQPGQRRSFYDRSIGRVTGWFDHASEQLAVFYQQILRWALGHRLATALTALAIFAASVMMVPLLGTEFVPKADFSETTVQFHTPQGSSIETTEAKARQVQTLLAALPEVRYTLATINTGAARGKTRTSIYVRLVDRNQRSRSVEAMAIDLRAQLRQVAGITVTQVGLLEPVGGQKQIAFSLQGQDLAELGRLNQQALALIRDIPGLVDVESSLENDTPRVQLSIKRDAASDLGLSTGAVAGALRTLLAGQDVGNWRASNDETYDVQLRLAPEDRLSPLQLGRLPLLVTAQDGTRHNIRLDQIAEIREAAGPSQINRRALTREVAITANVSLRSVGEVSADIRNALKGLAFAPGYSYQFSGSTKDMDESFGYALSALGLAIVFIYMILASQFKSFLQPLALMTALPLTLIGVVLALLMFGSALSMFSMIGVIMLMGLVTKNAILLVDFAIRARQHSVDPATGAVTPGLAREPALLLAARVRLRPILMTTLAMIFGMLPLALALTEGSEQRAPMGQAVIGGVITSSLLTLVVVPVMYCYMDDLANWARRLAGRTRHKPGPD